MSLGLKIKLPVTELVVHDIAIRLFLVKALPPDTNALMNLIIPGATTECKMTSYTGYSI